jgi:hypothetical protein
MADLNDVQAAQSVKIIGADSSGIESTPVQATSSGGIHANLRDSLGDEFGTDDNPIVIRGSLSTLPSLKLTKRVVLSAGASSFIQQTITNDTAIKELHLGGRNTCEGFLAKYSSGTNEFIPGGGFNSSGDVSSWTNSSAGSSAALTWTYATDQFVEGTGSAKLTFTQSDNNNYPEITYTFSTPKDMSVWKQIQAKARVTVAAGGSQTRTIQVRLTSGTAIRIYSITGTTTTAPFSTEQWHTILMDLDTPSSTAGTGVFDINNVNSISLRLQDGGNKAGSIWWDDVKLVGNFDIIDKIYTTGDTTQLNFDPVIVFTVGEIIYISLTNSSSATGEFQISTSGVSI